MAAFQFLLRQLDVLSVRLRNNPKSGKAILSDGFLPLLGLLLSPYGMERLLGSIGWGIDERAIEDAMARRGPGDVTTLDRLTHVTRQSVAVQAGPLLLTS